MLIVKKKILMINIKKLKELTTDLDLLYVEDDSAVQTTMFNYLKKIFSSVTLACDGAEGLSFFKKNKFDIVITDLSMPKMIGLDMIEK